MFFFTVYSKKDYPKKLEYWLRIRILNKVFLLEVLVLHRVAILPRSTLECFRCQEAKNYLLAPYTKS